MTWYNNFYNVPEKEQPATTHHFCGKVTHVDEPVDIVTRVASKRLVVSHVKPTPRVIKKVNHTKKKTIRISSKGKHCE